MLSTSLTGCQEQPPAEAPVRPVRAIQVGDEQAFATRSFPGTAEAADAVDLSFRVGGPLSAFPANRLGMQVKKGDLLAQIDARDFDVRLRDSRAALAKAGSELDAMRKARPEDIEKMRAEVARAEAAAQYAHAEHERNLVLVRTNAVTESEAELTAAKAKLADAEVIQARESLRIGESGARPEEIAAKESQIASLQAAVEKAQDELADAKLLAPFDGVVSAAYVENFEVVQPKQRIVRVVNKSELEIRVDIPENLISLVPQVTEATVTIQAFPDLQIPAHVTEIGTEASPTTRTYPVKLRFTPPDGVEIRPGMTGTVRASGSAQKTSTNAGYVAPSSALFQRGDKQLVWIYDPAAKTVRAQPVQPLQTTPFGISLSGVKPGDWIVTAGVHYLEEGQSVRLLGDSAEGDL